MCENRKMLKCKSMSGGFGEESGELRMGLVIKGGSQAEGNGLILVGNVAQGISSDFKL